MGKLPDTRRLDRRFELEKKVAKGMGNMLTEIFSMGLAMKEIKDDSLWRITHKKFDDYSKETFGYGKSWAYGLITLYDRFYPVALQNPDHKVDVTRMYKLLPHVTDENAEELYLMAANTNWTGFESALRNIKGKKAFDECEEHEFLVIRRCQRCGFSEKLVD